jgi:Protein of unknown function with PCYCGC motif
MRTLGRIAAWALVVITFLAMAPPRTEQSSKQQNPDNPGSRKSREKTSSSPKEMVPPYFKSAKAAEPLPATLPPSRFAGRPIVVAAYTIAKKIPKVLAQQPCYCGCNWEFDHHCLLDCYASDHTAGCATCVKEAFFAYEMTKQHKTPAQIRAAIIHGDWKDVDMNHPPEVAP